MRRRTALAGKAILVACMAAAPLLIHAAIVTNRWTVLIVLIPLAQMLVIAGVTSERRPAWINGLLLGLVVLAVGLVWTYLPRANFAFAPGISHALANAALLLYFARSLSSGGEAVLTRIAVHIRGPLPRELYLYTRRVTRAWCLFFAVQLIGSLVLFIWAPLEVWSFFINVLNLPLVLAMFACEYAYRVMRFPAYRHDSISDMMRVFARPAESRSGQADSA